MKHGKYVYKPLMGRFGPESFRPGLFRPSCFGPGSFRPMLMGHFGLIIPPANCVCGRVYCFHVVRPSVCPSVRNVIPPANCVCGRVYCFHVVRPSVRPCVRPSVTFCFLNILKSNGWNFIKPCIHIHIYRANNYNKK